MSTTPASDQPSEHRLSSDAPVTYPTNKVLAVVDSEDQVSAAIQSLVGDGFSDADVRVSCGADRAEALRASTGRRGLARLAIEIADRIGIQDMEMEFKSHYERALRDGGYMIEVHAPSDDQKTRAADILRKHDAHTMMYLGRFTIEELAPPRVR